MYSLRALRVALCYQGSLWKLALTKTKQSAGGALGGSFRRWSRHVKTASKWLQLMLKDSSLFHHTLALFIQIGKQNASDKLKCSLPKRFTFISTVSEYLCCFLGWLCPIAIHFTTARSPPLHVFWRQVQRGDTSQSGSVSGTVPGSRTHFQAKLLQGPSRETWSNLRPVMPSLSTRCPFTPTSFPFIRNLFSLSPPVR